jgi:hypothetical protein
MREVKRVKRGRRSLGLMCLCTYRVRVRLVYTGLGYKDCTYQTPKEKEK